MNALQQAALDVALKGHNLLINGPAGSGKSFVVKKIVERLYREGKKPRITCSTGIASTVYQNAQTTHRFLGLEDGRFGPNNINAVHQENAKYSYVEHNLASTDCLIVDECSMISQQLFDTIITVCRRKKDHLQLIFCGDFLQLPPVSNVRYNDTGNFCFQSELFSDVFLHRIELTEIVRTSEELLIKTTREVFAGVLSEECQAFITTLRRPLPNDNDSVKLFSRNSLADDFNRKQLLAFPGELYEHIAVDSGDSVELSKIQAPPTLWLKSGCPVILLQNLSDKLVNGLRGQVHSVSDDGPVISFRSLNCVTKVPITKFSVFSPFLGVEVAQRKQYPLKPAFGLTIHKAQGMTLDRVEIDCRDIFKPGQLGVALSRATTSSGLRIINFHPRYIMAPSKTVIDFQNTPSRELQIDMSCCHWKKRSEGLQHDISGEPSVSGEIEHRISDEPTVEQPPFEQTSTEQPAQKQPPIEHHLQEAEFEDVDMLELDDDFNKVIEAIVANEEETHSFIVPQIVVEMVRKNLPIEREVTDSHRRLNEIVERIGDAQLELFIKKLLVKLKEFVKAISKADEPITKGIPESSLNKFYQLVHSYNTSAEYQMNCILLFENEKELSDEHMIVGYKILESVRQYCIEQKLELIQLQTTPVLRRYVSDATKARIRYVAGFCVASLRKRYIKMQRFNMFSKTKQGQNSYEDATVKVQVLNALKEEEQYLKENSTEPDSLIEIESRQGLGRGLTNVTDALYAFFVRLTDKSLNLLVNENLLKYGKDMYAKCCESIHSDRALSDSFETIIKRKMETEIIDFFDENEGLPKSEFEQGVKHIFKELTEKYLIVLLAQFRKDVKSSFKLEKKMAHRKQVKVSSKKQKLN